MNNQSAQYILGENTTSTAAKEALKENYRNKKSVKLILLVYIEEISYKVGKKKKKKQKVEDT